MTVWFEETTFRVFGQPVGLPWVIVILAALLGLRLVSDRLDRKRITALIVSEGGSVSKIVWDPLGKGWLGGGAARIYEVTYRTRKGKRVTSTCRTSLFTGVYWTGSLVPSDDEVQEMARCRSCGEEISPDRSRCPKCGWCYV